MQQGVVFQHRQRLADYLGASRGRVASSGDILGKSHPAAAKCRGYCDAAGGCVSAQTKISRFSGCQPWEGCKQW